MSRNRRANQDLLLGVTGKERENSLFEGEIRLFFFFFNEGVLNVFCEGRERTWGGGTAAAMLLLGCFRCV